MTEQTDVERSTSFPLSEANLLQWFDTATVHRARAYLQAGKVLKLEYQDDLSQISAQVWGAGFAPYRQKLSLEQIDGRWRLTDSCSCPVGGRCKHVLAVLLKLKRDYAQQQQRLRQLPLLQLDNWFAEVEQQQQQPETVESEDTILYLLSYGQAGLQLYPRRVKRLKKGGYSKGQPLGKYDLISPQPPSWLDEEDYRLLTVFRSHNSHEQHVLEARWGYELLQELLATGRCFFGEARYEVSWQASRALTLQWQTQEQSQRLRWQIAEDEANCLIFTDPPCFINTDHYELGLVDTSLSGRELKLLAKMPPIPASQLALRFGRLQQLFKQVSLPVPEGIAVQQVNVKPTPVLALQMRVQQANMPARPTALLYFDYAGQRLPLNLSEAQTEVILPEQSLFIKRQRAIETTALEQLIELGLVSCNLPAPAHTLSAFGIGDGPDNPELWQPLLDSLDDLAKQGWQIEQASDFNLQILDATPYLQVQDGKQSGFELGIQVDINGQQVPLLPLISQWLRQFGLPSAGQTIWLSLPQGKLALPMELIQPLIDTIVELLNLQKSPLTLELPDYKAAILPPPGAAEIQYLNANRLSRLSEQLHNFNGITEVALPAGLNAVLRSYQQQGLNWLVFLRSFGLGGVLADDMGLGKTLQTLSFMLHEKQQGRLTQPALIVCPTSLLGNWQNEAARFTPALSVLQVYGAKRRPLFEQLADYDVIVTSYPLLVRDLPLYRQRPFSLVVLDEAQHIKNAGSQAAQSVRALKREFSLALSGTPLENHLGELKSLFDFVLPGLLGTEAHFNQVYRKPIEKHGDVERANHLKQKIAPFMLRRTKRQVAAELPEKTEIVQLLELEADQRNLYESIRLIMETKVRELFIRKGVAASHIEFLDALLKLRQACCDARLVPIEQAQSVRHNAKLSWLRENLPEMIEEGRRVLLFSQFASMLHLIEQELDFLGISYSKLTGQTKQRQQQIDAFQNGETEVFLISLKAGGTGLNLTAADTVIHYDPWWNPAAENQATDRAHRIGQDKAVFVYKLIARNTVEEKVQQLQQHKQGLADQMLGSGKGQLWQGNAEDLLSLFAID